MKDFSLIRKLAEKPAPEKPSHLGEGISYQQYELEVDGHAQIINIPLRECDAFEQTVIAMKNPLTRAVLKHVLREHRGVREQE